MKKYTYNGEQVKIMRPLQTKKTEGGKSIFYNIADKEGNWVQVEYETGKNKGNRFPTTLEKLK